MIHLLDNKKIDKQKWDQCIEQSKDSCVYVYSWYLDAVYNNWSGLVLNDYEAVFPIAPKSKYGIKYLFQPFFARYFGVFSKKMLSKPIFESFFDEINQKYPLIEVFLHENTVFSTENGNFKERQYQILDLNSNYKEIHKNFSENTKRNIKKAEKVGFFVKEGIKSQEIVDLFKHTKGENLSVFKKKDYTTLVSLMDIVKEKSGAEALALYNNQNELCAAAFFIKNKNRFIYLKGGVTEFGRKNGAMHFLFDHFIKKNANTETFLDFGGSSVESVARFYKGFGAKDCVYLQLKKNTLPRLIKWLSKKK
jgi:hypothetical protein